MAFQVDISSLQVNGITLQVDRIVLQVVQNQISTLKKASNQFTELIEALFHDIDTTFLNF